MTPREPQDALQTALDGIAGVGPRRPALDHLWPITGSERSWLLTGRAAADRRRARGGSNELRQLLVGQGARSARAGGPWGDFSSAMERQAATQALGSLRPDLRDVVRLAYFEGYSNRALAESAGLSVSQVRARLREALLEMESWMRRTGSRVSSAVLGLLGFRLPATGAVEPPSAREVLYGAIGAAAGAALMFAPSAAQAEAQASSTQPPVAVQAAASPIPSADMLSAPRFRLQEAVPPVASSGPAEVVRPSSDRRSAAPGEELGSRVAAAVGSVQSKAVPLGGPVTALPAVVAGTGTKIAGGLGLPGSAGALVSGRDRAR